MAANFTSITRISFPDPITAGPDGKSPEFIIEIASDGEMPFVQAIFRGPSIGELIFRDSAVHKVSDANYAVTIPAGSLGSGRYQMQVEGCKRVDLENAVPDDWVKYFADLDVRQTHTPASVEVEKTYSPPAAGKSGAKLYFGIHKHMHQPYYRAVDPNYWDGMLDEIFGSRTGAYRSFVAMAARQYQALPYASLSMSWSGSLIEQLDRASRDNLVGGAYSGDWKRELSEAAHLATSSGSSRAEFSAFGFYHPLMPLIPGRDIVEQILRHRQIIRSSFGVEAPGFLFPPETAFHVRMIPALEKAGIEAVMYDSIHRYRSCRDYPYAGREEGMLPPNPAEQENPPVDDWLQLHNVWAGSKISPRLLRPEYVKYEDVDGTIHKIIAIPAERYIGNEDARGGFGALVYPDVLGQVLAQIERTGSYDPKHPPFFLLHSDGDNYGGGTDSYYGSNTGQMIEWLKADPRFELTGVRDYLSRFPPDRDNAVHIEPGSWSGADNGDPQFMKWFSRYNDDYSPDLNSWAVLTAFQNAVHTLEDAGVSDEVFQQALRLLLTAEASDYWYWTGQDIWDQQVTDAANRGLSLVKGGLDAILSSGRDTTAPTIFPPWITPENPGGLAWGNNCLTDAAKVGTVHTFIYDVSGIQSARLFIRRDAGKGKDEEVPLTDKGPYPCRTGATATAHLYEAELPVGVGDIRYWLEAVDGKGNKSRSALERVFLA
jgi:Alpha-amylase/alpha-mannosidase